MLSDLFMDLLKAETKKEKEDAYRAFEKVGMDRATVNVVLSRLKEEARRYNHEMG